MKQSLKVDSLADALMNRMLQAVFVLDKSLHLIKSNIVGEQIFQHHQFNGTTIHLNDIVLLQKSQLEELNSAISVGEVWHATCRIKQSGLACAIHIEYINASDTQETASLLCVLDTSMEENKEESEAEKLLEDFSLQLPWVLYQYKMYPDGKLEIPYLSNRVMEVFGYTKDEIQNNPALIHAAVLPEDRQKLLHNIMQSAETLDDFKCEYRVLIKGKTQWVMAISSPKRQNDGSIVWTGYTKNITERKEKEIKLKESETKFRTLIDNSPNLIFTHTPEGSLTFISDYALHLLEIEDVEAFKAQNIFSRVHPEDMDKAMQPLKGLLINKKTMSSEPFRLKVKDRFDWVIMTGAPIFNELGLVKEVLSIGTIITPLIEQEEALKRSEAMAHRMANFYQSLINSQAIYLVKTDAEGNLIYVNDYYQNIFGNDVALIGRKALESIYEEDKDKTQDVVLLCLKHPEKAHSIVLRKINSAGQLITGQWEFTGKTNTKGEVEEILCIGHDITELMAVLKKTEVLLEVTTDQNSRLQNFAYIVSHNIRSHSANLLAIAQMMDDAKEDTDRKLFQDMLKTSTQRLEETIQNLNEIITIQRSVNQPKAKLNLFKEVEKAIDVLSEAIHDGHAQLNINIPRMLNIKGIPAYVDSILLNVVSNAYKYRSPNRKCEITIVGFELEDYACIEVTDNGLGIDMKKAKGKLFGMYKTFHQTPDAKGLGLFMTKNQIEALGGKIEVESEVDKGTKVTLCFRK